ncbi:MAG: hypothetical protein JO140_01130 [Candidatus Eremiobacteraeota bacterium]|nr:hypothetical protein [Candidatus Eremiobacteraeota bacterium]
MATSFPPRLVESLLHKHEIPQQSSAADRALEAALGGYKRGDGQKMIALTIGTFSWSQPWPVSATEASGIVERFRQRRLTTDHPRVEASLADAIVKASRLYDEDEIETFVLQPVHFDGNGYGVDGARMFGSLRTLDQNRDR